MVGCFECGLLIDYGGVGRLFTSSVVIMLIIVAIYVAFSLSSGLNYLDY